VTDAQALECALVLHPLDGDVSIAFAVRNSTAAPFTFRYLWPFADFELRASAHGEEVTVVVPAFDLGIEKRVATLEPGETIELQTPFRLRFDASVPPSGGDDWRVRSLRSDPVAVTVEAVVQLDGNAYATAAETWDAR
jgi:hypothetical protein